MLEEEWSERGRHISLYVHNNESHNNESSSTARAPRLTGGSQASIKPTVCLTLAGPSLAGILKLRRKMVMKMLVETETWTVKWLAERTTGISCLLFAF